MAFISIFAVAVSMMMQSTSDQNPLPEKTDIPADYGGASLCKDVATSIAFLRNHHVVNRYGNLDSDLYIAGRRVTGCRDNTETLEIIEVIERRKIGTDINGPYIAFRAQTASGSFVTGVVGEGGNNRHPRSEFQRWLRLHAPSGFVEVGNRMAPAYSCPTSAAALAVVRAIRPTQNKMPSRAQYNVSLRAVLKANNCVRAVGKYKVIAVRESTYIDFGFESGYEWTALEVTDARFRQIGLIFDANLL